MGFVCHYLLDSTVHPFRLLPSNTRCATRASKASTAQRARTHAVIESEIDEVVLNVKRGETIATFNPSKLILRADDHTLDVISALYPRAWPKRSSA